MSFIRTLSGDIDPRDLGLTYAHDHLFCIPPLWKEKGQTDFLIDDLEASIKDVELFVKAGGQAVYDATAIDYGRDPVALKAISDRTGIKIIATAGFNKAVMWPGHMKDGRTFQAFIDGKSRAELAAHIASEVTTGLDGTNLKGGVVKFGTGYNTISEAEDKAMRAALDAHKETGAPIHSHTELGTLILEQLAIVKAEGVDPTRLTIAHVDRNPDPWVHRKAAETGVFMCFDGISRIKYHPESVLIDCILKLAARGHEKQIMIGGDIARRTMYRNYGEGGLGLGYILESWVPRFIEEAGEAGFDGAKLIHTFMVENPQRAFAFTS
ncbi:phosphotriesterase-related protein [Kaistia algarum]|uniref:phosphotriesterase family protein n=1 Tax=Kaistia algarum TaxID=2083279 RepID=UPI000CE77E0A|nr:phosphotriesterase [Kaistia algarum]MCX5512745.1 phosphotriesterase [Kaistia algarum]PPE81753.1 phosphotriesterase-related protein [Kaistia algarum]